MVRRRYDRSQGVFVGDDERDRLCPPQEALECVRVAPERVVLAFAAGKVLSRGVAVLP